jgi:hypothetical protein
MVELTKIIKNFILIKYYTDPNNEIIQQINWVSCLRLLGLEHRAQFQLTKIQKSLESNSMESLERYEVLLKIAEEQHELKSLLNQFDSDLDIPNLTNNLDLYYHIYKIELQNRYILQQKGLPLPEIDSESKRKDWLLSQSPLFNISFKINELLTDPNPSTASFLTLMQELKHIENKLSFNTQAQYYTYLRNLCTLLINGGKLEFVNILHRLNLESLDRGLFFINNEIASHAYTNIVHIAIRVKEYQWALEFMESYKKRIIGGDPNQFFYQMNRSLCLFALKRYDEALSSLPDPSLHIHYQGTVRCLELKIYYELQSELLMYKMYAFRKYFERTATKTVSSTLRTMYIEFFNIMLQLTQSPPKDKKRSQQLIERINKKKLLADRAWLLEKARELG